MEYKRLGDYIREVNVRNRDEKVTKLVGLTIDKAFIPSVANVIGTDLSTYKVIRRDQFACSLMQVSRDGKMPVAMFEEDAAIMSPAYPMFEVAQKEELLPQYLMMWFSRSEFDREASYYAVGGVRGSLTWEDFCSMRLPVPSIERQREIVDEYETLSRRISLNEQMIQKLEATAQALYRKMFVDGIDKENLPEGWRIGTIEEFAEIKNGKAIIPDSGDISVYGGNGIVGLTTKPNAENVIVIGRVGINCGSLYLHQGGCYVNDNAMMAIPLDGNLVFLYLTLKGMDLNSQSEGSGQPLLTQSIIYKQECVLPPCNLREEYEKRGLILYKQMSLIEQENSKLKELQSLLLAKMGN
jgi:type I restriction enzyme S subunit